MLIGFRQTLLKMGKFHIGVGFKVKGITAIFVYLVYLIILMMWYSLLASLWLLYGMIYLMALPIKGIKHQVDCGNWKLSSVIKVSAAVFGCMVLIGFAANAIDNIRTPKASSADTTVQAETQQVIASEVSVTEDTTPEYAEDELVNRFLTDFISTSSFEVTKISKGNIRTKYYCEINGCWTEIINATSAGAKAFCITITGGNKENSGNQTLAVMRDAVKALDPSLTDDQVDIAISDLLNKPETRQLYQIGDNIAVTYTPPVELSQMTTNAKADIIANNYK